ncbi:hypothetical protein F2Q70_00035613 [Brassica cretica]|uniref:Uncharacterized protein n=1 Tax=Brassica cretica TaxID=69181 RepID=A0A8S9GDK7_BRACR|nr:hypothetical protein F2Q68_00030829 [Brassica cretica]KAF2585309.1 hypothetical protein F2Q70_00035613 [Brassica cretica]
MDVRTARVDFMPSVNGIALSVLLARFGIRPGPVLNYFNIRVAKPCALTQRDELVEELVEVGSFISNPRDENLKVEGVRGQAKTRSERGETISGGLDSGMDWTNGEKQDFVGKELHQYLGKRKIKKDLRNLDKFVSWEIRVLWQSNRLELSRTGSNHDGIEARRENPKLDKNHNFGIMQVFDEAEGSGNIYRQEIYWKDRNQANGPRSSRWLVAWVQNVVSTTQQAECLQKLESCNLTSGRSGGVLHVSWTYSQTCGARGVAAHASGAMRSDTRAATNLNLIGCSPRDGSVQLNSSRPLSSFDDQLEILSGVSSVLRVQISLSSARYSAGKSEELCRS